MGVRIGDQDKVTYCHFDCYPEGLGKKVVSAVRAMLRDPGIEGLKQLATELRLVDGNSEATPTEQERFGRFADDGVSTQKRSEWYVLLRELQGDLKGTLQAGVMIDSHEFLQDSLFCEYAYIVNLDDMAFECYRGFQREPHTKGRYAALTGRDEYKPVALVGSFDLADIPQNWAEQAYPDSDD
jgi:hypothetical protein